jgi:protein-tyrosine phosphatase
MTFTEIHFHLLPGIDDGPSTVEESVALAAAAAAEGTRTIVTTPHIHSNFIDDPRILLGRVQELQARLRDERVPVELRCGGEVDLGMVERLSDAELEAIAHGPRGRRWVLLEAPLRGLEDDYNVGADELRARGFGVVVAHPERSFKDPEAGWRAVEHELAAGSALQINAWSVAGRYGDRVQATALALLRRAPRAVVASDAHGGPRMPALRLALETLRQTGTGTVTVSRVCDPVALVSSRPDALLERGLAVAAHALAA